jgi:hypothetical protein
MGEGRTCAGLTTTTGKLAAPRPAATTLSNPPVVATATIAGASGRSRSISHEIVHVPPSLPKRASLAAPRRLGGDCSGSMERRPATQAPRRARTPHGFAGYRPPPRLALYQMTATASYRDQLPTSLPACWQFFLLAGNLSKGRLVEASELSRMQPLGALRAEQADRFEADLEVLVDAFLVEPVGHALELELAVQGFV